MTKKVVALIFMMNSFGTMTASDGHSQVSIRVDSSGDDIVGKRLVYNVKEELRESSAFKLLSTNATINMLIHTMDRFPDSPNVSTMYSVVWLYTANNQRTYLDSTLGFAGADVVDQSAETIVANTDDLLEQLRRILIEEINQ